MTNFLGVCSWLDRGSSGSFGLCNNRVTRKSSETAGQKMQNGEGTNGGSLIDARLLSDGTLRMLAAPCGSGAIPPPVPSPRQKLVLFTEHRDTLDYLPRRIGTLLGRPEAIAAIHGGMGRAERRKAREAFLHDPRVRVLLATDAAGEGINLQRAHRMASYDLPWNPNRLEQRFGRIHRIGRAEVCHLWNPVAEETREGGVYRRLPDKLEQARHALGGQVFDVLGKLRFEDRRLCDLPADRGASAHSRHHGRDARGPRAGGRGARRGPPVAAALRGIVLPRSLPPPRRRRAPARAAPLRDHPRPRPDPQPGPADRRRRAGAETLRTHRLRQGPPRPPGNAGVSPASGRKPASPGSAGSPARVMDGRGTVLFRTSFGPHLPPVPPSAQRAAHRRLRGP